MEAGQFISDPITVAYVLRYYLLFWIFNSVAYGIVSYGLMRWLQFTRGLDVERALRTSFIITLSFGTARLVIGAIGIALYMNGLLSPIETILAMGVTSLFLNTAFILGEGLFLNREAKNIWDLPDEKQSLVKDAIKTFESLRRTVKNA
jgi:hypothetical protein